MPTHDPDAKRSPMLPLNDPEPPKITDEEFGARLADPFPPECVEWRVGNTTKDKSKGMALAYLTARAVMDRLDAVCGPAGWETELRPLDGGHGFICRLMVKYPSGWRHREDGSDESDIEGVKGGISGALKRAAVHFGIGRYLYSLEAEWVPLRPMGRSYAIAGDPPRLPAWALPGGSGRPPAVKKAKPAPKPKPAAKAEPEGFDEAVVKQILHEIGQATEVAQLTAIWQENKDFINKHLPDDEKQLIINAAASRKHDIELEAAQ